MSGVHFRSAQPTDAGAVGALLTQGVRTFDWMPRLHSAAQDISHAGCLIERGWVTVAEMASKVVGFSAQNGAELNALYVAEGFRGQGLGGQFLTRAKAQSPQLELWTFQANTGAQRFYLRHGFAEAERSDGARNDEKLPDIRYVWAQQGALS